MRVIIFGNGYIGSNLNACLYSEGVDVLLVDKSQLDYVTDGKAVKQLIDVSKAVAVINCSGYTGKPNVDAAEDDKVACFNLNVGAASNISKACLEKGVPYYHISSGCIYTGFNEDWNEEHEPNFGRYNPKSSWYSTTKHLAEMEIKDVPGYCIRPRMPFGSYDGWSNRDFLKKLLNYDNLVDPLNSKTYVPDMCRFITWLILNSNYPDKMITYNYTQLEPLTTREVTEIMTSYGYSNPNWDFVDWDDLNLKAGRSNCTLSMDKIIGQGFTVRTEKECLHEFFTQLKNDC